MRELYCVEGCGHSFNTIGAVFGELDSIEVAIYTECPMCNEVTEHRENVEMETTFRCTECDLEKDAKTKPSSKRLKTRRECPECERKTTWVETGWTEIDVE